MWLNTSAASDTDKHSRYEMTLSTETLFKISLKAAAEELLYHSDYRTGIRGLKDAEPVWFLLERWWIFFRVNNRKAKRRTLDHHTSLFLYQNQCSALKQETIWMFIPLTGQLLVLSCTIFKFQRERVLHCRVSIAHPEFWSSFTWTLLLTGFLRGLLLVIEMAMDEGWCCI